VTGHQTPIVAVAKFQKPQQHNQTQQRVHLKPQKPPLEHHNRLNPLALRKQRNQLAQNQQDHQAMKHARKKVLWQTAAIAKSSIDALTMERVVIPNMISIVQKELPGVKS